MRPPFLTSAFALLTLVAWAEAQVTIPASQIDFTGFDASALGAQPASATLTALADLDVTAFAESLLEAADADAALLLLAAAADDHAHDADQIPYDNLASGLTATHVQAALDELADSIESALVPDGDKGDIVVASGVWSLDKAHTRTLGISIDGAGATVATGLKGYVVAPWAGTITGWSIAARQSGSVAFDITKIAAGDTPPTASIVASAPPALSTDQFEQSTTLTGWTTSIAAGDILGFEIDSAADIQQLTLTLTVAVSL